MLVVEAVGVKIFFGVEDLADADVAVHRLADDRKRLGQHVGRAELSRAQAHSQLPRALAKLLIGHRGDSFQSVYVKLASAGAFDQFRDELTTNPQLKVKVVHQAEFLADQSSMLTKFIQTIGFFIATMMAPRATRG